MNALQSHSQSFGVSAILSFDGWGHPLHYYYSESEKIFFLISYGSDGSQDRGLYDGSGRPTLRSPMQNDNPQQDLICKHDLNSDNSCRLLTSPFAGSRNAAEPGNSEIEQRQKMSDAMNSLQNPDDNVDASASSKTKQQATAQRMRKIGNALVAYSNQNNRFPAGGSLQAITDNLEPAFIKQVPQRDGWGNAIKYEVERDGSNCWLISFGADGQPVDSLYDRDGKPVQNKRQNTTELDDDLIYSCDKGFLRAPAEVQ